MCLAVVELRQYTLHPGLRDTLIELFEREFIDTQESVGITLIAQFRDIDRPDVFVWLRGFPDMPARATALAAFYSGPAWVTHRDAANRTMVDSDNVLLLRPARSDEGFMADIYKHATAGSTLIQPDLFVLTIYALKAPASDGFRESFENIFAPELARSGASPMLKFETEPSANNFPRLPIREGEYTFVWLARFANMASYDRHIATLESSRNWREFVNPALEHYLSKPAEVLRLKPTAGSRVK